MVEYHVLNWFWNGSDIHLDLLNKQTGEKENWVLYQEYVEQYHNLPIGGIRTSSKVREYVLQHLDILLHNPLFSFRIYYPEIKL